jgi:hypothetical protein
VAKHDVGRASNRVGLLIRSRASIGACWAQSLIEAL